MKRQKTPLRVERVMPLSRTLLIAAVVNPTHAKGRRTAAFLFESRLPPKQSPRPSMSAGRDLWARILIKKKRKKEEQKVTMMSLVTTLPLKRNWGQKALMAVAPRTMSFLAGNAVHPIRYVAQTVAVLSKTETRRATWMASTVPR
jgi:hypothetical protein